MEHTPGPWYEGDKDGDYIPINKKLGYGYMEICLVSSELVRAQEANARLIAAAPELLEACKEAVEYLANLDNTKNMVGPEYGIWHRIMARIAKAEGKEAPHAR